MHCFFDGLADRPPLVAICVFCCWFTCVFDAMCIDFLIVSGDRPPFVAICMFSFAFLVFLTLCA